MRGKLFQSGNSKMEYTSKVNNCLCVTFSLPAIETCPFAGVCKTFCFSSCGTALFRRPKEQRKRNYIVARSAVFVDSAISELVIWKLFAEKKGLPLVVRLHDSGDFFSFGYLKRWFTIMEYFPEVTFYCYTKSHRFLWGITEQLPKNFFWVPSPGGVDDHLIELHDSPCAKPVPETYQLQKGEVFGSEDDLENLLNVYEGKTICLIAHGAKKGNVK